MLAKLMARSISQRLGAQCAGARDKRITGVPFVPCYGERSEVDIVAGHFRSRTLVPRSQEGVMSHSFNPLLQRSFLAAGKRTDSRLDAS